MNYRTDDIEGRFRIGLMDGTIRIGIDTMISSFLGFLRVPPALGLSRSILQVVYVATTINAFIVMSTRGPNEYRHVNLKLKMTH